MVIKIMSEFKADLMVNLITPSILKDRIKKKKSYFYLASLNKIKTNRFTSVFFYAHMQGMFQI